MEPAEDGTVGLGGECSSRWGCGMRLEVGDAGRCRRNEADGSRRANAKGKQNRIEPFSLGGGILL